MCQPANEENRVPRKRSTFELTPQNYQMIYEDGKRLGLSDNGTLNMDLTELREWRAGIRVFRPQKEQ